MAIALKVDVDTLRGTREGVPALLRLFDRYGVRATFLFSLGPDHTGRALRRVFRPGFLSKVRRTSVMSHYGLNTLLYGTLLPGPNIGRRCADILRSVAAAGHEVGVHCYDHVRWQDAVAAKDFAWTKWEIQRAMDVFISIFGFPPKVHGAAGWQLNAHVPDLEGALGFGYASDCRGHTPFWPVIEGHVGGCLQLPTTLPTLDELMGRYGIDADNVQAYVFAQSRQGLDHVYTLHAELEGMKLLPVMERLLVLWRGRQQALGTLGEMVGALEPSQLPRHQLEWGQVEGRSGRLAVQGKRLAGLGPANQPEASGSTA